MVGEFDDIDADRPDELVSATEITLEEEDITYLEELYEPLVNLLSIGTS